MNAHDERTVSLWAAIKVAPDAAPLRQDDHVDVVVAGSGIAGLSVAYELALAGLKVAVIDRGRIGGGMTARTTAHLTSICDAIFPNSSTCGGGKWLALSMKANLPQLAASKRSRRQKLSHATSGAWTGSCFRHPEIRKRSSTANSMRRGRSVSTPKGSPAFRLRVFPLHPRPLFPSGDIPPPQVSARTGRWDTRPRRHAL